MSGHSHWSTIKHKKAAVDSKRGRLWSKLARVVIVAAKTGGGDPAQNLSLRYAIDKAKEANMPKDTIEKAIKKGTGELGAVNYEEIMYEGYAHGGVAVMVEALTDNRHRTAPEIKNIFEKRGCSLGSAGCVGWMFSKKGLIIINKSKINEDDLMEIALGAGADDMKTTGDNFEIVCAFSAFEPLKRTLADKKIPTEVCELSMVPQNTITVSDVDTAKTILGLMEDLDENDDVQNVYANFDIPEDIMAKISS